MLDSGVAIGCAGCAMHTGPALWGAQNLPDVVGYYKNKFGNSFIEL